MRVAQIYLILMAVLSLVLGLVYLITPSSMLAPMGFGELRPSALTDVRANYGGFQIGTGLFMLWCLPRQRRRAGMLLALLLAAAITMSRVIGLALDGEVISPLRSALVVEIVLTLASLAIYVRMPPSRPEA